MTTVAALVCQRLEPDLQGVSYGQIELPAPGAGEIQVAVRAAALNFPDLLMTEGLYQHKPPLPFVPGMEGAGVVVATGSDVESFSVGDAVRFSNKSGACAERVNVPQTAAWPKPESFSFEQAAAFQVGAITAWVSLVCRGELQAGETLLVHGASGGMGAAAVQLGVHLGARVIATGTSLKRLELARQCGASEVITLENGFREQVKALTEQRGVDVVFDPVGGDVFDESLRVMAWGGRLLVVGFASGRIPQLPVNIALIKGFSVVGVRAGEYGRRQPELGLENQRAIQALANAGVMTPHIGAQFALSDAKKALQSLRERGAAGKIVVTIDDAS